MSQPVLSYSSLPPVEKSVRKEIKSPVVVEVEQQCTKIGYATSDEALTALETCRLGGRDEQAAYKCKHCSAWHLTSNAHISLDSVIGAKVLDLVALLFPKA
jgi:hypothetical protein